VSRAGAFSGSWPYWWQHNKDHYIDERRRSQRPASVTGSSGYLTGRGRRVERVTRRRPDPALISADVLPILHQLATSENDTDILDSSVLAMARASDEGDVDLVIETAVPLLGHKDMSVQSSAALSLGVLGHARSAPMLAALMADTREGRRLAGGRGRVPEMTRAFAALSLGLVNDPDAVPLLCDLVAHTSDSTVDLKVCAIVALGLMDNARCADAYMFLLKQLEDRKLDPTIRSYVPTSLARLAGRPGAYDPAALATLMRVFSDQDTDLLVRQSVAIAFGQLGAVTHAELDDNDVLRVLVDEVEQGRDEVTRQFSLISLAQIGGRDDAAQDHAGVHDALRLLLGQEITTSRTSESRSWAALAAATYASGQPVSKGPFADRIGAAYDDATNPHHKGAFAISLGLLGAASYGPRIIEDFSRSDDQDFKGCAALSLGMLDHRPAAPELRRAFESKSISPTYGMRLATGLGLLADREIIETLIQTLETSKSLSVNSAVAKSLGMIGDASAIDPLKAIAEDKRVPDITRAFACVALGMICERTEIPWNARIARDNNYVSTVPAISEILDIL
jgi:HEAT repeat protein